MRFQDELLMLKPTNPCPVCGAETALVEIEPPLCTSILRFTDTSVTGAGPSNPWLCFARRIPNFFSEPERNFLVVAGGATGRCRVARCPLWVTCGRRPGKSFFDVGAALVGCGHVSGLLMRQVWPLALMLCADRVPIVNTHF